MTMDTHNRGDSDRQDRALWQRARPALAGAPPAPGEALDEAERAGLLAAYLDGRLDEAGRERVEAWLACDADALDSLIAARAGLGAEAAVPPGLIVRAQGLVREPGPVKGPKRSAPAHGGGVLGRLRGFLMTDTPLWQPVGLAAALLVACVVGFELGEEGYTNLLADQGTQVADIGVADSGFDLAATSDDLF